ncbi:MAG: alkaline phosphatase D family protein [Flammeovirgaceae bacterium]
MKYTFILLLVVLQTISVSTKGQQLLQSGPMVGYSTMSEVGLWVQTKQSADVYIEYWEKGKQEKWQTFTYTTQKHEAYSAHLIADQVKAGKHYEYALYINGKEQKLPYPLVFETQVHWQWRADPPNFKFAMGSCNYVNEPETDRPGTPYGGEYVIFQSIQARKPNFMLWLGDNTYLRETDWNSKTGIYHRYTHTRSLTEMQALLGSTHHYAIWDDHDFGPNNSDRSFWNKELTKAAFKRFWMNPNYVNEGITGTFQWADVQFFLLDNRYFRSPNHRVTGEKSILGLAQEEWLIDALKSSQASFKFIAVGGQFINTNADFENHALFQAERERILGKIRKEKIEGVVFLSGDRHHTELSRLQENDHVYPIYDFTVSPLTSGTHVQRDEPNRNFVEGTLVDKRNFGEIEVTGKFRNRTATLRVFDSQGKLLWEKVIKQEELSY